MKALCSKKRVLMVLSILSLVVVSACSNRLAYELIQGVDNEACRNRVNDENKVDCVNDDVRYEDYKKQREELLNSPD